MYTELNLATWHRKELYDLFRTYDDPFFNLVGYVDVTDLRSHCKATGESFLLHTLFISTKICNEIQAFRLRMKEEKVLIFDTIHTGSTILLDDESFRFCYIEYSPDRAAFLENGRTAFEAVKQGAPLDPGLNQMNVIHHSSIPWVSFSSFKHARKYGNNDSVPKITFGKYFEENGRYKMPLSVEVHHALMDGLHVGRFFERYQEELDDVGQ